MTRHLNDEQLQTVASGKLLEKNLQRHYEACEHCQAKVKEYKKFFQYLKLEPVVQLSSSFLGNLMKQLPEKETKFSLDILWIILGGLISFGVLIYFVGIKPFQQILQSINGSFGESVPLIWEPVTQIINNSPISGTQFIMGGMAIVFILIADFLCRHIFTRPIKRG